MENQVVEYEDTGSDVIIRGRAYSQIREATELLKTSRPKMREIEEYPANNYVLTGLISIGIGIDFSAFSIGLGSFIAGNALLSLIGLSILIPALPLSIGFGLIHGQKYLRKPKRFLKPLSYILSSKRQRAWVEDYQKITRSYEQSMEMYQLLVAKVNKELAENGTYDVLNDFSNPRNVKFYSLDLETGEMNHVYRTQIEKRRLEMEKKQQEKDATDQGLVQKALMEKILDDKPLLS